MIDKRLLLLVKEGKGMMLQLPHLEAGGGHAEGFQEDGEPQFVAVFEAIDQRSFNGGDSVGAKGTEALDDALLQKTGLGIPYLQGDTCGCGDVGAAGDRNGKRIRNLQGDLVVLQSRNEVHDHLRLPHGKPLHHVFRA